MSIIFISFKANGQYSYKDLNLFYNQENSNQKKIDSLLLSIKKDTLLHSRSLYFFSRIYYKHSKYQLSLEYGKKHLNYLENFNFRLNTEHYHNALHQFGLSYLIIKNYENAIKIFKKSSNLNIYPTKKAQSLCQLSICYREIGDYRKSIDCYVRGLKILKLNSSPSPEALSSHYTNLSLVCNLINTPKDTKLGIFYLNKADSIVRTNYKNNKNLLSDYYHIYNSLGNLYSLKHEYDFKKAKYYYFKTIKKAKQEKNNLFLSFGYSNLGELYFNKKKDSALYYFKKALASTDKVQLTEDITTNINTRNVKISNLQNLATYYLSKLELQKALSYIQKPINLSFGINNNTKKAKLTDVKNVGTRKRYILKALKTKIKILLKLYIKDKKEIYSKGLTETVRISDLLVQQILNDITEKETLFLWREDISQIYFLGSYASHLMKAPNLVFEFQEKNKAFLLSQSVSKNDKKSNLPYHISNRDLNFRKKILNLENLEEKNNNATKKLKDSLFDLKFAYQNFNDSIQKIYPQYFKNKKIGQQISLKEVKKQLDNNTAILSYTINYIDYDDFNEEKNNKSIIGLLTTKNKSISFSIENAKETIDYLNSYRNLISKPFSNKEDIEEFRKVSFHLFDKLFPSNEIKEMITGKQLLIIPDNDLQNIPFESLNTSKDSLKYLIETNDISYSYSMSFLDINKNIKRETKKDFTGFAPIHFNNKKLNSLDYSKEEIKSINAILNTNSFIDNFATKNEFLKSSTDAKIIHLATHVNISKTPVIHFNNDSLKLHELYTYKNNADLVVLSACETNLGEIKEGEGVLSLARGFFYSGSKSVVSSLWKVNDASTSGIMTNFYTNLKNRQTKVKALNNAKRKYLEEHSLSEKSPYYWASFILIGDTSQTFKYNYFNYFLVGFSILMISFLFFLKKRG